MRIDFETENGTLEIDSNYVTQLTQEANLFSGETFYIGSTVCRAFTLSVDRRALNGDMPYAVTIYDDNNVKYADLVVDSIDDSDIKVYTFHLTDRMVRLNEQSDAWFEQGATLYEQLENISVRYNIGIQEQLPAYDDMEISWYNNWTAREFVSWVAELLGGYAYIGADNTLYFASYWHTAQYTVNVEDCDSFRLGEQVTIDRVVYDTPSKTVIYPENYSGTGSTLYLNTNNELFTDSGNITIESQAEYIYNEVNGLSFYNVEVGKCPINPAVRAGSTVGFVLDGNTYMTIAQVNWNYNTMWVGGYSLHLDSPVQAETQIQNPITKMGYTLTEKIDRENGIISSALYGVQEQANNNSNSIVELGNTITRSINGLALDFNNTTQAMQYDIQQLIDDTAQNASDIAGFKDIIIQGPAGITILNPGSTVYGQFGSQQLSFVDTSSDQDGIVQAWVGKDGLGGREVNIGDPNTQANQWRIFASPDGKHLHFTRHS